MLHTHEPSGRRFGKRSEPLHRKDHVGKVDVKNRTRPVDAQEIQVRLDPQRDREGSERIFPPEQYPQFVRHLPPQRARAQAGNLQFQRIMEEVQEEGERMRSQILKQPSRQASYPLSLRRLGEVEPIVALETNDGANEPLVDE